MSDFRESINVNTNLIIPLGSALYNVAENELTDVTYDEKTNQYSYNFEGEKVNLYSTKDILNHYFGDNLEDVLNEQKIYTITLDMGVDVITYEGVVIGFGANSEKAEIAFNKAFDDYIPAYVSEITFNSTIEFLESDPETSFAISGSGALWAAIEEKQGTIFSNLVAYFFSAYHLANTGSENNINSSEYVSALVALNGLDRLDLSYLGNFIISEYTDTFLSMSDKKFLLQFYTTQEYTESRMGYTNGEVLDYLTPIPASIEKFFENFGVEAPKSYQDWLKQFEDTNDREDIIFTDATISIPFDYERFFDVNFSDYSNVEDVSSGAGTFSYNDIIDIYETTKDIETSKIIKKLVASTKNSATKASNTVYDPIILDLDGDGFNVETKENGVNFDLDKNRFAEKINWTTKDGFLCLDLNGNGSIDNGGEVFGDQTM